MILLLLLACGAPTTPSPTAGPAEPAPERPGDRELLAQARGPLAACSKAVSQGDIAAGCASLVQLADLHAMELLGHSVNADMLGSQLARVADAAERAAASRSTDNPDDDAIPVKDLQGMLADLDKAMARYDAPDGLKLYPKPPTACQPVAELATTALRNLDSATHRLPKLPAIVQAHGVAPLTAGLPAHLRTLKAQTTIIRARAEADRAWWEAACASDQPEAWGPAAAALKAAHEHEAGIVGALSSATEQVAAGSSDPAGQAAVESAVALWTASEQSARAVITPLAPPK